MASTVKMVFAAKRDDAEEPSGGADWHERDALAGDWAASTVTASYLFVETARGSAIRDGRRASADAAPGPEREASNNSNKNGNLLLGFSVRAPDREVEQPLGAASGSRRAPQRPHRAGTLAAIPSGREGSEPARRPLAPTPRRRAHGLLRDPSNTWSG